MSSTQLPPCRLYALFARKAPIALLFRRGPSKWTHLILWNTKSDQLVYGQWFKGRLYERRSDLSPDGTTLIYFASKFNRQTLRDSDYSYAWTAMSKPPYLTALALWPKGDCWHGGGLFLDNHTVLLNHKPAQATPHPAHPPQGIEVTPNPDASGEDDPLYGMRLTRDGWAIQQEWAVRYQGYPGFYHTEQPEIRVRAHPSRLYQIRMTRSIQGLAYRERFVVEDRAGKPILDLPNVAWADWDQQNRLVLLQDGKVVIGQEDIVGVSFRLEVLADLNPLRPEAKTAPGWATRW